MSSKLCFDGQVVKIVSNRYTVKCKGDRYVCSARGKIKLDGEIYVGDYVKFEKTKPFSVITEVLPRRTVMIRPYIANMDACIIVIAKEPEPDLLMVDKVILNCFKEGIEPIIVYNKCDLTSKEEIDDIFKVYKNKIACFAVSSFDKSTLDVFESIIQGRTVCFAGQSATGKTSLLNALTGLKMKTDVLSEKILRGKNTTRHIELFDILGGQIADTCGFSMLETIDIEPEELTYYYDIFVELQDKCKFRTICLHIDEPDCEVKKAVARGDIDKGLYDRYLTIYKELKETRDKKYD